MSTRFAHGIRFRSVVLALVVVSSACTGSPSGSTTSTTGGPPATAATTSIAEAPPQPSSTTTRPPRSGTPAAMSAHIQPGAVGRLIDVCAGLPAADVTDVTMRDADGYHTILPVEKVSQNGTYATCWSVRVPSMLSLVEGRTTSYRSITEGTYRVLAITDDGTERGEGRLTISDHEGSDPDRVGWEDDALTLPAPFAITNAHGSGGEIHLHGGIDELVEVASPARAGVPGHDVHLWTDPDAPVALPPSEFFSVPGGVFVHRGFDVEVGHEAYIEEAERAGPPVISSLFARAVEALGSGYLPYRQVTHTDVQPLRSVLNLSSRTSGYTFTLSVFERASAGDCAVTAPGPSDVAASVRECRDGQVIELSVLSGIPSGDGPPSDTSPRNPVSAEGLEDALDRIVEDWFGTDDFIDQTNAPALHRSLLAEHVRAVDAALNGPTAQEEQLVAGRIGVTDHTGSRVEVVLEDLDFALDSIAWPNLVIDFGGPVPVFSMPISNRFFCHDAVFRVDADLGYVRDLAAEVCRSGSLP